MGRKWDRSPQAPLLSLMPSFSQHLGAAAARGRLGACWVGLLGVLKEAGCASGVLDEPGSICPLGPSPELSPLEASLTTGSCAPAAEQVGMGAVGAFRPAAWSPATEVVGLLGGF